jgi:hypothetical protein
MIIPRKRRGEDDETPTKADRNSLQYFTHLGAFWDEGTFSSVFLILCQLRVLPLTIARGYIVCSLYGMQRIFGGEYWRERAPCFPVPWVEGDKHYQRDSAR